MSNFTRSVVYSGVVLVAGLIAIFSIYENMATNPGSDLAGIEPAAGEQMQENISENISNMAGNAADTADEAGNAVAETAEGIQEDAVEAAETVQEGAADAVEAAQDTASEAAENIEQAAEDAVDAASEGIDNMAGQDEADPSKPMNDTEPASGDAKNSAEEQKQQ